MTANTAGARLLAVRRIDRIRDLPLSPDGLEGIGAPATMNGKLREVADEFIRLETDGIREYKTLVKESSGYYHGLFKVLLDGMIRDSEKHVELLKFLKESLKDA